MDTTVSGLTVTVGWKAILHVVQDSSMVSSEGLCDCARNNDVCGGRSTLLLRPTQEGGARRGSAVDDESHSEMCFRITRSKITSCRSSRSRSHHVGQLLRLACSSNMSNGFCLPGFDSQMVQDRATINQPLVSQQLKTAGRPERHSIPL
jgi:hypothetical protein